MNDLFEKIYEYNCMFIQGMLFVGLKAIFTKWWLVLISIPVGMTSLFGIFYSYILEFKKGDFFGLVIAFLLFFFVFFVPVIYYARKAVDKEIIARTKRKYGILFESREKAVAYSLAKIFDISTDKFWDYADTLKKVRIHYFSLEDPISSTNYFKFIYDPDSKASICSFSCFCSNYCGTYILS